VSSDLTLTDDATSRVGSGTQATRKHISNTQIDLSRTQVTGN